MLVTEPFWVVAITEDYVCVASLFYVVMLVHDAGDVPRFGNVKV